MSNAYIVLLYRAAQIDGKIRVHPWPWARKTLFRDLQSLGADVLTENNVQIQLTHELFHQQLPNIPTCHILS